MGRYKPEVERTVYFSCLEALQNTYKHAREATAADVVIAERGGELRFEVTDDGEGFDPEAVVAGAGLHHIHDRVSSLGGSLMVEAGPARGTRISGAIRLTAASYATGA